MEIKNFKVDKMLYQTNSISYLLVILSLAFSIIALFTLITFDTYGEGPVPQRVVPDFRIGVEISIGIILMLITFFAAEKVRYYSKNWSLFGLYVLAIINALRIFNIPVYAYEKGWIPSSVRTNSTIEFAISAGLLIAAGVIASRKVIVLRNYMKEIDIDGNTTT